MFLESIYFKKEQRAYIMRRKDSKAENTKYQKVFIENHIATCFQLNLSRSSILIRLGLVSASYQPRKMYVELEPTVGLV